MNNFKPHSKFLLEKISGKLPSNNSTNVVEQREEKYTDPMTTRVIDINNEIENITEEQSQKVIIPRHIGRIRRSPSRYEDNIHRT